MLKKNYQILIFFSVIISLTACSVRLTKEKLDGVWESQDTSIAKIQIRFDRDTMQMIHDFSDGASPEAAKLALQIEKRNPMSYFNYLLKADTIFYTYQRLPAYLQTKEDVKFYYTVYEWSSEAMVLSDHGHLIPFVKIK